MTGYFRAYSIRVREATRDLDENNLRVYLSLLSYANCEGMCWPGIAKLVADTGVYTDAIYTALEALVAQKYIIIVRTGTRDPLTHSMLPNVYKIDGAVIDDDCADDEFRTDDPILFSREEKESQHHQGTQPESQPESTQPDNTPSSPPDSFEVEVQKPKPKTKTGKEKTPERSSIPKPPNPVPPTPSPRFFNGSLREFGVPLPVDRESVAMSIYVELEHKMPIRLARYLVATYGDMKVRWALKHLQRQSDVRNPAGYMRHLLEKDAIEQADAGAPNPGDKYVTGPDADYIDH